MPRNDNSLEQSIHLPSEIVLVTQIAQSQRGTQRHSNIHDPIIYTCSVPLGTLFKKLILFQKVRCQQQRLRWFKYEGIGLGCKNGIRIDLF